MSMFNWDSDLNQVARLRGFTGNASTRLNGHSARIVRRCGDAECPCRAKPTDPYARRGLHGGCACGAVSEATFDSRRRATAWHRQHKLDVLAAS